MDPRCNTEGFMKGCIGTTRSSLTFKSMRSFLSLEIEDRLLCIYLHHSLHCATSSLVTEAWWYIRRQKTCRQSTSTSIRTAMAKGWSLCVQGSHNRTENLHRDFAGTSRLKAGPLVEIPRKHRASEEARAGPRTRLVTLKRRCR